MPWNDKWKVTDAAKEIGIAVTTLYRWIDREKVEPDEVEVSEAGFVLITPREVDRLKTWVAQEKLKNNGTLKRGGTPGRYTPHLPQLPKSSVRRRGSGS